MSLATALLAAGAAQAPASVTIGQLAPGNPPLPLCNTDEYEVVQPTVTSGNPYVMPGDGTVTSWSTNASGGAGQRYSMRIFRSVGGLAYLAVARSGPITLTPGLNTTATNIAVRRGDLLGLNVNDGSAVVNACGANVPSESYRFFFGSMADGTQQTFTQDDGVRLNVTAVFNPTNTFSIGATTRSKKKGTATVDVTVPNPGEVAVGGTGVKIAAGARVSVAVTAPGTVKVPIRAQGKKKKKLKQKGKVKVAPTITYTPTGGTASTQSLKLKLRKKLKK